MATILRDLSYRYQWLYDAIARLSALTVGGEKRFRQLAIAGLDLTSQTKILDLCCGSGQGTQFLLQYSQDVTGLDASPKSLQRAQKNVPGAEYAEGLAEELPFGDRHFDLVHVSVALHEMEPIQLREILQEVYRVLKVGGMLAIVDLHAPTNWLFWPGLSAFMLLFETETAWQLLKTNLPQLLQEMGFELKRYSLHAGGSLQVIQAQKTRSGEDL